MIGLPKMLCYEHYNNKFCFLFENSCKMRARNYTSFLRIRTVKGARLELEKIHWVVILLWTMDSRLRNPEVQIKFNTSSYCSKFISTRTKIKGPRTTSDQMITIMITIKITWNLIKRFILWNNTININIRKQFPIIGTWLKVCNSFPPIAFDSRLVISSEDQRNMSWRMLDEIKIKKQRTSQYKEKIILVKYLAASISLSNSPR